MQKIGKKAIVQVRERGCNGKDLNLVIFLTDLRQACDFSTIREGAPVGLFWVFRNGSPFATIRAGLIVSLNDTNRYDGAITIYAGVANHTLQRYTADAAIAKPAE